MWLRSWLVCYLSLNFVQCQRGTTTNPLQFRSRAIGLSKFEQYKIKEIPSPVTSMIVCGTFCAQTKSCSRFLADKGKCHLLESWPLLEDKSVSEDSPITIQELETAEWSQVMVLGGVVNGGYTVNVEVLDMKTMKQCTDPPKLPKNQFRGAAFVIEGEVNYAMGHGSTFLPFLSRVHLDLKSNQWKETNLPIPELSHFPVAQIRESWVLIIGGKDSAATYIVYGDGSVVPGPALPHVMSRPCGIGVDEDHFFVAGNGTFVLNWSEQVWIPQAPMANDFPLVYCETFLDQNNDLSILVGHKTFEIFSWSTRSWRPGPTMLDNLGWGQFARYNGIPYLFGGRTDYLADKTSNIYAFDPVTETWSKISLQMKIGRASFGIVKIPPGIVDC